MRGSADNAVAEERRGRAAYQSSEDIVNLECGAKSEAKLLEVGWLSGGVGDVR